MIRDIILAPDPFLREKTAVIDSKAVEAMLVRSDLEDTFDALEGQLAGLAANQIGYSLAAMLVDTGEGKRWLMFNPKVVRKSTIKLGHTEGCASIPDVEVYVTRPSTVMVAYDDVSGKHKVHTFMGYESRIVQHEIDHLNGILITDYESEEA